MSILSIFWNILKNLIGQFLRPVGRSVKYGVITFICFPIISDTLRSGWYMNSNLGKKILDSENDLDWKQQADFRSDFFKLPEFCICIIQINKDLIVILPVRQLPVCCQDWPALPAVQWRWYRCWIPAWVGRLAPNWSHRRLRVTTETQQVKRNEQIF